MTADGVLEDACVCEYGHIDGQHHHILVTCCDCDALDVACDRCSSRSCRLVVFVIDIVIVIVVNK